VWERSDQEKIPRSWTCSLNQQLALGLRRPAAPKKFPSWSIPLPGFHLPACKSHCTLRCLEIRLRPCPAIRRSGSGLAANRTFGPRLGILVLPSPASGRASTSRLLKTLTGPQDIPLFPVSLPLPATILSFSACPVTWAWVPDQPPTGPPAVWKLSKNEAESTLPKEIVNQKAQPRKSQWINRLDGLAHPPAGNQGSLAELFRRESVAAAWIAAITQPMPKTPPNPPAPPFVQNLAQANSGAWFAERWFVHPERYFVFVCLRAAPSDRARFFSTSFGLRAVGPACFCLNCFLPGCLRAIVSRSANSIRLADFQSRSKS